MLYIIITYLKGVLNIMPDLEKILNGIIGFLPTLLLAAVIYAVGFFINKIILKGKIELP